jgi:hypothetical protein
MDITQIEKKEKRRRDRTYTVALGKWKQLVGIFPLQGTVLTSKYIIVFVKTCSLRSLIFLPFFFHAIYRKMKLAPDL